MSAEPHPDTEKYYQRVKRHLQEIGKWEAALEKWSRKTREGEPIAVTGEQALREAVSRILDRCEYAGVDPEALDWHAIAELAPDYENPDGFLAGLTASQLVPPPSPSEEAFYTYAEQEVRRLIDILLSLPPERRRPLVDEIVQRSGTLEKLLREAEEAGRLRRELREYERKVKALEEQLKAMHRKAAPLAAPQPTPTPPPPPRPEWERRLEGYRAEFLSKARRWVELFIPRDRRRAVEEEARRLWREYEADIAEACRAGRYQLAEQRLRDAEQDLAKLILTLMPRDRARALSFFQEQGVLPKEEVEALARTLPPEAAPPGYVETPHALRARGRPVPAVAYWASQPVPVIADSPNPWERAFGPPVLRRVGATVELHMQTYAALVKMAAMARVSPPESNVMGVGELKSLAEALRGRVPSRWAAEWLDKLLDRLELG
jgi:hypothetical protein